MSASSSDKGTVIVHIDEDENVKSGLSKYVARVKANDSSLKHLVLQGTNLLSKQTLASLFSAVQVDDSATSEHGKDERKGTHDDESPVHPTFADLCGALKENTQVVGLLIDACEFNARACAPVADMISQNKTLRFLSLDESHVGSAGIKVLSEALLKHNFSITEVSLFSCDIGEEGGASLASLLSATSPNVSPINKLNLNDNKLSNRGALALCEALKTNKVLKVLHIQDNSITDPKVATAFADMLLTNPCLTEIEYEGNEGFLSSASATARDSIKASLNRNVQADTKRAFRKSLVMLNMPKGGIHLHHSSPRLRAPTESASAEAEKSDDEDEAKQNTSVSVNVTKPDS